MSGRVITCYTDGSVKSNPGQGGWGVIFLHGDKEKCISGSDDHTTNNRMELMAAIMAVESITVECDIHVHTDSQYVKRGITEWIHGWKRKNYSGVKNDDLWRRLDAACQGKSIKWVWVRAHVGNHYNEKCDVLAKKAAGVI